MSQSLRIIGRKNCKYDEITFLKGFSIITIVLLHYLQRGSLPNFVNKVISFGGTGTHIFFFCSGFGLYLSYLKKPFRFAEFFKKRFVKIYIPYILIVGISALLPYMYDGNRWKAFLSHLLLYKMFVPEYESSFGTQFWYISTLFQLYFIFIPLVKLKERLLNSKFFGIVCFLASVLWWIMSVRTGIADQRIWGSFFLQYLWEFSLGMLVAEYLNNGNEIRIRKVVLVIFAFTSLGIAGALKYLGGYFTSFNDCFAAFGYGAFALIVYSLGYTQINQFVKFTSGISYELYLVHILVLNTVCCLPISKFMAIAISLPVSYLLAWLYHKVILCVARC